MVLEKLSLDPVIVGTLSVVAVAVLWLMGVRGADLAAAGILIVGVMTLFGDRYPIMRVAVLVGSVVVFIAIMTGVIPKFRRSYCYPRCCPAWYWYTRGHSIRMRIRNQPTIWRRQFGKNQENIAKQKLE